MYTHVLVGTDGSPTATKAVESAAQLAQVHRARLTIVHAFDAREPEPRDGRGVDTEFPWLRSTGTRAEALVNTAIDHALAAACGALHVDARTEPGRPVGVLLTLIEELEPDAVIVGNADRHRVQLRRTVGHALSRRVHSDVVIVDTIGHRAHPPGRRRIA